MNTTLTLLVFKFFFFASLENCTTGVVVSFGVVAFCLFPCVCLLIFGHLLHPLCYFNENLFLAKKIIHITLKPKWEQTNLSFENNNNKFSLLILSHIFWNQCSFSCLFFMKFKLQSSLSFPDQKQNLQGP